jgi:hypothetical protein
MVGNTIDFPIFHHSNFSSFLSAVFGECLSGNP